MKIIEAMKKLKHLNEKAADLRAKVAQHCADLDFETALYPNQRAQVDEWIQSHSDTLQEIARLRVAIQRTNLATSTTIELGNKGVTKTIAEWIHRRRDLAKAECEMWSGLGDKGLREGTMTTSGGAQSTVHIRRYYDPKLRDDKKALYTSEPTFIDAHLEVVNAVTDIIES